MRGPQHALGAGITVAGSSLALNHDTDKSAEQRVAEAIASGGLAAGLGSLPDWLEPATHPNHRQFFHSFTFGLMIAGGVYQLYRWQPTDDWDRLLRVVGLVAGGAYITHLIMDSTTKKSLPLI